jgi:hypothetical protein
VTSGTDRRSALLIVDASIVVAAILGLLTVIYRDDIVPIHFSFDGLKIQGIARSDLVGLGDVSYGNVAEIYRFLGLEDSRLISGLLGYFAFLAILIVLRVTWRPFQDRRFVLLAFGFVVAIIFASVYLGTYTKELFVLPIVVLALLRIRSILVDVGIIIAMVLYAGIFRQYWYVVCALYVGFRLVRIARRRAIVQIVLFAGAIAVSSLALAIALGTEPDHLRSVANLGRLESGNAQSAIQPIVSLPQPIGGVVNNVLTGVFLLFPIPLAIRGGIYYVFLGAMIAALWASVIVRVLKVRPVLRQRAALGLRDGDGAAVERAWSLLLAFVTVQTLFEPDYGSAVRHVTPLLLLAVLILSWGAERHVDGRQRFTAGPVSAGTQMRGRIDA